MTDRWHPKNIVPTFFRVAFTLKGLIEGKVNKPINLNYIIGNWISSSRKNDEAFMA